MSPVGSPDGGSLGVSSCGSSLACSPERTANILHENTLFLRAILDGNMGDFNHQDAAGDIAESLGLRSLALILTWISAGHSLTLSVEPNCNPNYDPNCNPNYDPKCNPNCNPKCDPKYNPKCNHNPNAILILTQPQRLKSTTLQSGLTISLTLGLADVEVLDVHAGSIIVIAKATVLAKGTAQYPQSALSMVTKYQPQPCPPTPSY